MAERGSLRDRRKQRWLWVDHEVIDEYAAKIGPHALSVYVYLVRRANSEDQAWPSIKTICEALGMGRTKAKESLQILYKHELVGFEVRVSETGDPDTNLYTILEVQIPEGRSPHDPGVGRHTTGGRSPHDHKEETGKNKQGKKEETPGIQPTGFLVGFEDLEPRERDILEVLQSIPYFPAPEKTIPKIREYSQEWPQVNGLEVAKDYRAFCEDKGKRPTLLQLRNFYKNQSKNTPATESGSEGASPGRRAPRKVI